MSICIYEPRPSEMFERCLPVDIDMIFFFRDHLNGTPRASSWVAPEVKLIRKEGRKRLLESDAPWMISHAMVLRRRVVERIGDLLEAHGEVLPLRCADADLVVYNPRVVDALDEEASSVGRFPSGRIGWIDVYEFRASALEGVSAFKIPNAWPSEVFVDQRFVDRWNAAGLTGMEFDYLWSDP